MAYFIVIGTNNDVKSVVDEVKRAHLQHNVVTSGCIIQEEGRLYYQWDVFNQNGEKTQENKESIELHDALTNQISQFKTLLPEDAIPNVFIVSKCYDEEECETLQMVYDELCQIGGATLCGLQVDIVLLGYDLNKPEDVTIRPSWRLLESLQGLGEGCRFHTNILYVNNMDYKGAATNVDSHLLSRFLCHWSKMVCAGGYDPKASVLSHVYSIGMSEHQYDFRDLNEFFKLSAEERLLNRTLNNNPSSDTQTLLDFNYFKKIDLDFPWLDGLCYIKSLWDKYCSWQWNPSKSISENEYSVTQQELAVASYLNLFLKLYISEEQREIDKLNNTIKEKEKEKSDLSEKLNNLNELPQEDETKAEQIDSVKSQIAHLDSEIEDLNNRIQSHLSNIEKNSFLDADSFHKEYGSLELITEEDETSYNTNKTSVKRLIDYVKSDAGVGIMRDAIDRATEQDKLPNPYPASEVYNIGRIKAIDQTSEVIPAIPTTPSSDSISDTSNSNNLSERHGCCPSWLKGLFKRNKENPPMSPGDNNNTSDHLDNPPAAIAKETCLYLKEKLGKSVVALKKADEVRRWWNRLCIIIDKDQKRLAECKLLMDGEKDINGKYVPGKEGYRPHSHQKSISLIDMEKVRTFRDSDTYYKRMIDLFLDRWFDKNIEPNQRMTMLELIKHQVLDPLVGRFHTLSWDGTSPFVNEDITDDEMHEYIEHDLSQSKPFVEYVRIQDSNLVSNLSIGFYSNNPNIPKISTEFRNKYNVSSESLNPVYLKDFVNSLCVIQVMDIPNHVDALRDFKPRRETSISKLRLDIKTLAATIIGNAETVEDKARAIYNWICNNIAYDTSKQIHDAETCYKTRKGVCQAYCELFCYMAEVVGVTANIIAGKSKDADGRISEEKHSWVFVYTHNYDGMLIDPTWGAGAVDGAKFVKSKNNSIWFNVSPYWMIFSHFPDQQYWTKLDITITEEQFKKLPFVSSPTEKDCKDYLFECISKISEDS